ncbi:MAG: UDP-N-acetylglucosamine diphosphorylase/glucosamine-1-phosphate N-acetyltransferase [Deltaproteobacteria bacterium]|nr:MAG: UDP-N-acetylglucosamine diphosphorylase/glucosamine-1-phosphate N-acetyltransferase [Deltaproteobacteria bacterium]
MEDLAVVILAAGKGTRMKSRANKVLHPIMGRPMITYPVAVAKRLGGRVIVVVGHEAETVRAALPPGTETVLQSPQRGTGHAVACAAEALAGHRGYTLLLYGDVPLLRDGTLSALLEATRTQEAAIGLISIDLPDPQGYGRIVRDGSGRPLRIVEERDATAEERAITEINTGIYAFHTPFLLSALSRLRPENAQGEYYLTDLVEIAARGGERVVTLTVEDREEVLGINDRLDLAAANRRLRMRILEERMCSGVTILDPATTWIEPDVELGIDSIVYPMVTLRGKTKIGEGCTIDVGNVITDSEIGADTRIAPYCVITESRIEGNAQIGPFARLRPGTHVCEGARVGNFVEMKKTQLGPFSKVNHLSYLGDATVGEGVNIGAGTITCNYDGQKKHPTIIEDGAFIGSDTQLVAPVRVGKNAYIGSGTTVTSDVPENALAVSRVPQRNIQDWVLRKKRSS